MPIPKPVSPKLCLACEGSGKSSKGEVCFPCNGKGKIPGERVAELEKRKKGKA